MQTMTNLTIGIPDGWEPEEDCSIAFRILHGANSGPFYFCIASNQVTSQASGSQRYYIHFRWLAADKVWVVSRWNLPYVNAVFNSSGVNKEFGIQMDERFLPVIDEATP